MSNTYTKSYANGWFDGKDGQTPITATKLNNIETQLEGVYNAVLSDDASVATKTEVSTIDAKFDNYTNTTDLNTALSTKVNTSDFDTFKLQNTSAIDAARTQAVSDVESKGYAIDANVASTYATKAEVQDAMQNCNYVYEANFKVSEQFGKYNAGATVPAAGKTIQEVIQDAFCNDKLPNIIYPSATLSININTPTIQLGDTVAVTYSLTTNPGSYSYGPATGVTFYNPEITINGETKAGYTHTISTVIEDISTTFTATASVSHRASTANANTQLGNTSDVKIDAGVCEAEASKTVSIVYPIYSGVIDEDAPISVQNITNIDPTFGNSIPSTQTYTTNNTCPVIAYPSSFGAINTIKDGNNFTQTWRNSTVTIEIGSGDHTADITYNVYVGGASTATETYRFN